MNVLSEWFVFTYSDSMLRKPQITGMLLLASWKSKANIAPHQSMFSWWKKDWKMDVRITEPSENISLNWRTKTTVQAIVAPTDSEVATSSEWGEIIRPLHTFRAVASRRHQNDPFSSENKKCWKPPWLAFPNRDNLSAWRLRWLLIFDLRNLIKKSDLLSLSHFPRSVKDDQLWRM